MRKPYNFQTIEKNERYYYYFLFMNLKDESLSINTVREDIFIFSMFF